MDVTTTIPDTLELTDMADLAIHHITSNVDPQLDGAPYFYLNMVGKPASCVHDAWDYGDVTGRYVDAAVSLRQMTKTTAGLDAQQRLEQLLLKTFDPVDGLSYRPELGWCTPEAGMFDQGRALTGLLSMHMASGAKDPLQCAGRLVSGLYRIARHEKDRSVGDYCQFPFAAWRRDHWSDQPGEPTCYGGGCTIYPVVRFFEITGDPMAEELATRLVNYIVGVSGVFRDDGDFRPPELLPEAGHFHSKTLTALGVLKYGLVFQRDDLVAWARRVYEYCKTQGSSFGWFPEGVGVTQDQNTAHSETCCTVDMIELAILLARRVDTAYWDDVERFTRNYLCESQIRDVGWLEVDSSRKDTIRECFSRAREAIMGGFVGRARPHDLIADGHQMACCCGAGARAIYQVWNNVVERRGTSLSVNLLLNHRGPYADVQSWLPFEGRIRVQPRCSGSVRVRIPGCLGDNQVVLKVQGEVRTARQEKGYVVVEAVKGSEVIELFWEIPEQQTSETIASWTFDVRWRGDTVTGIEPAGDQRPLYLRAVWSGPVQMRDKPCEVNTPPTVYW